MTRNLVPGSLLSRITSGLLGLFGAGFLAAQTPAPQDAAAAEDGAETSTAKVADPDLSTLCPVSGKALGSMGEPVTLTVEGRTVRLCCKGCTKKMQAEPSKYFAVVDERLAAQQKPWYPLAECVVSGKPLTKEGKDVGLDVVVANRLFRLCCERCAEKLRKDPAPYFAKLDQAVVAAQSKDYPLKTCLVAAKSELGSMGDPVEIVVANRLVRFCCKSCRPKFDKDPASFLARLDAAWTEARAKREGTDGAESGPAARSKGDGEPAKN